MSRDDILHELVDVAAGRKNLPPHRADEIHEELTPGYTAVPPSEAEMEHALAVQAAYEAAKAKQAAAEQPAGV